MSKAPFIAVLVALAAFLLGRWAPNRDLRAAKAEIEQLREMAGRAGGSRGGGGMEGVTRMLQIPAARPAPVKPISSRRPEPPQRPAAAGPPHPGGTPPAPARPHRRGQGAVGRPQRPDPRILPVATSRARRPQRAQFRRAGERDEHPRGLRREQLGGARGRRTNSGRRTARGCSTRSPGPSCRPTTRWTRSSPPNWREAAGPDFQLFELIDPKAGERLLEVDGLISEREDFGPPPRGER
ncbi:MAG: hypothetical protein U1F77_11340 [Kiritimatiellia bacterium]